MTPFRRSLASVLLLPLAGCGAASLSNAVELSTAGSQASAKLLTSAQTVETAFASSLTQDRFLRALQAAGLPQISSCSLITTKPVEAIPAPPLPLDVAGIAQTKAALRARTELAAALGKSYSAMNALASYDARGAIESGLANVFGATNTLRANVGLPAIPDPVTKIVPVLGGALVQHRQVAKLKQASARLRVALEGYKQALEAGKRGSVSVLKDEIGESYDLQIALWRRGYLDANGLLAETGASSGLTVPGEDSVRFTAKDEALCKAVRTALEGKRDELRSAVESEYDAQINTIDELIAAHEKFEAGAPLDPTELAALLDQLTSLAQEIGGKKNGG